MVKIRWKKILLWTGGIISLLIIVLAVHIYMVTRPKAPDAKTIAMARIDLKQNINDKDAGTISNWLYQQPGVNHVLCNKESKIVVFTFHPVQMSGNAIVEKFKSDLKYKAERFMPTKEQMQSGCPVASASGFFGYVKSIFKI
jgi:hypothetical protein